MCSEVKGHREPCLLCLSATEDDGVTPPPERRWRASPASLSILYSSVRMENHHSVLRIFAAPKVQLRPQRQVAAGRRSFLCCQIRAALAAVCILQDRTCKRLHGNAPARRPACAHGPGERGRGTHLHVSGSSHKHTGLLELLHQSGTFRNPEEHCGTLRDPGEP